MSNQFQTQNNFQLAFTRLPNVMINLQQCNIPSIQMTHSQVGTPFSFIKEPDTKINYGDFMVSFKLDENFDSYLEIFNWMKGLGFPKDFTQYSNLKGDAFNKRENIFSDATLTTLTNASNSNVRVEFQNMFPITLSEIDFSTMLTDANNIDVFASFAYDTFDIYKLPQ